MFGPFRPTSALSGGLLWKRPWRLSPPQKARQRARLRHVDRIVATLDSALAKRQEQHHGIASSGSNTTSDLTEPATSQSQSEPDPVAAAVASKARSGELQPYVKSVWVAREPWKGPQPAGTVRAVERWKAEMPTEAEMVPWDKYTIFDRKERRYRKGIHKLPKWTRLSQRINPPGF